MSFRWTDPVKFGGRTEKQKRAVIDLQTFFTCDTPVPKKPVISIHKDGRRSYIWIGDDKGSAYATVGPAGLRQFAKAIIASLDYRPRAKRKARK